MKVMKIFFTILKIIGHVIIVIGGTILAVVTHNYYIFIIPVTSCLLDNILIVFSNKLIEEYRKLNKAKF